MKRFVRVFFAVAFLLLTWRFCVVAASAEPCPIFLRYLAKTADPRIYTVGFRSYKNSSADVVLTVYAGDDAYTARIPDVALKRDESLPEYKMSWVSGAAYVRLPTGAAPLDFAKVDIVDATSHSPIGCSTQIETAAGLQPRNKIAYHAFSDEEIANIDKVVGVYASAVPIDADPSPSEPVAHCAHPYAEAATRRISQPAYPALAAQGGHLGTVGVLVELDSAGKVLTAQTYLSSGWPELDEAARNAAFRTTYSSEVFRCQPMGGIYFFGAAFAP